MYRVLKYNDCYKNEWNNFLKFSKNGSFLFDRDFMDYHSDRFEDFSLMIFDDEKLISIFPANIKDNIIYSHQGLSYGGFVLDKNLKLASVIQIFFSSLKFLKEKGVIEIFYKVIPKIYCSLPSDEIYWIFFILKAELFRCDVTLTIFQNNRLPFQKRRTRSIKKASNQKPFITECSELEIRNFWDNILSPNLFSRYGVKPVHTVSEIYKLAMRFPDNIRHFNIYRKEKIMAGCTMFLNNSVAHAQYISGSEEGRAEGYLDYLFDYLINERFKNYSYFDFGICNENEGVNINNGLLDWKEGFGARSVCHDFFRIETNNYFILNKYISDVK